MEIEEMKALWSEMSDQLEQQKKLTNEIIMNMTQERYTKKFRKITNYETVGAVICYAIGVYILFNFDKLELWYLQLCGIVTITFLFVMPFIVLRSLGRIKRLNIANKNYKETLIDFTRARRNLLKVQQFGIYISFIIMFAVSAVYSKIWSNKDFFVVERGLGSYIAIGIALLFFAFISRWGYRSYMRITNSAEDILKELE